MLISCSMRGSFAARKLVPAYSNMAKVLCCCIESVTHLLASQRELFVSPFSEMKVRFPWSHRILNQRHSEILGTPLFYSWGNCIPDCGSIIACPEMHRRWVEGWDQNLASGRVSVLVPLEELTFRLPPHEKAQFLRINQRQSFVYLWKLFCIFYFLFSSYSCFFAKRFLLCLNLNYFILVKRKKINWFSTRFPDELLFLVINDATPEIKK